jgi:N utilization substance protein A
MNNDLLAMLDYLERDRGISKDVLKEVIEESLINAARRAVGPANELRVNLDLKSCEIQAIARLTVVERVRKRESEISLLDARERIPDAEIGDEIDWEVTPENFGRIAAQTARQGIMQRLRQAEKTQVVGEYEDRVGEMLYGSITRHDKGDVVVNFGRTEGVLRHNDRVPREDYHIGDHLCCVLMEVNADRPGPILQVSRSAPELVRRLFEREVAEIAEKVVEIKEVAREPGYRSKIAVHSNDSNVDPVGACVGVRGSRVKTIVRELNGEKVDIVRWSPDIATFVRNAMQPAELKDVVVEEDARKVTVVVEPDQLSLAIGKRGQNVRLTNKLTSWLVEIQRAEDLREQDFAEKLQALIQALATALDLDIETTGILVRSGIHSVEGIMAAPEADIAAFDGLDDEQAALIKEKARQAVKRAGN